MWVTLEQTTVLPRRASTITASTYRGPIHRGATSTTRAPETLSGSSAPKEVSNTKSQPPRARFAEDLVIGPTNEANSRISRRKSALKSRSPNGIIAQPSETPRDNSSTSNPSQTRRSSFTSTSFLLPPQSLSPRRCRTTSMIATTEIPRSDHFLRVEDFVQPTDTKRIVEGFDPFKFRQRAYSMSNFSAQVPPSRNEPEVNACEANLMQPLSHPNESPLVGYFMEQDALFRDDPRRRSSTRETDSDYTSMNYETVDCGDSSRPVSSISSNTSSFSSTLLDDFSPPTPFVRTNIPTYNEKNNIIPARSIPLNDEAERYSLLASALSAFNHEDFSNKWVSNSSTGPMVSPLERLSSSSYIRPSLSTRQRSGTVLPPKKPEIISENSPSASSAPLSAQPMYTKSQEKPTRPPARPPRSNLREIPSKLDHSGGKPNGKTPFEVSNQRSESSAQLNHHPANTKPVGEERSIYGSASSQPVPLPSSEPIFHQPKPNSTPIDFLLPESRITTVKPHSDESRVRPAVPPKASSRNSSRSSGNVTPKYVEAPLDISSSSKTSDSCCTSKITDDDSDEFESADEGDEEDWSVAEGLSYHVYPGAIKSHDAPTDGRQEPLKSQGDKFSSTKTPQTVRYPIIGAFPRSESFPESFMSYSSPPNSKSHEEPSFEEPLQSLQDTTPTPLTENVFIDPPHQTRSRLDFSTKSQARPQVSAKDELPTQMSLPLPQNPSIQNATHSSPHSPTNPTVTKPLTPPFEHNSRSRTCSLEGLAALRNSNSPSGQSPKKKTGTRSSVHLRQLSKIINFCAKDGLLHEKLSDESPVPIPVEMAQHQPRPTHSHSNVAGSSPHPTGPQIPPSSWKNSMPKASYDHLKSLYGDLEMQRQEVIWELSETENSYAVGLRQVIEIFASPLRTPEGAWISGVPIEVAKLFDWLEDIVNLHSQLAFQAKSSRQYQTSAFGLTVHIAEIFLELTPKLEIYQPYLVRFSQVTALIEEMIADPDSDFGEFVRMQTDLPECGKMSLNSFLLKPIQRLMKYPLFFKQLCEVTAPDHPNHASTIFLLNSTDTMIRVLQEVKEREDEYEKLKVLEAKIKSLPPGFRLARRDRRLLAQGLLKRVQIPTRDRQSMYGANYNQRSLNPQVTQSNLAISSPSPQSNYSSELMTNSDSRMSFHRKWSQNSLASSFSAGAVSNKLRFSNKINRENHPINSSNYPLSPTPPLPDNKQFYDWTVVDKSADKQEDSNHYLRKRATSTWETELESRYRRKNSNSNKLIKKFKESPVHVFVFSDLILLATRHSEGVRLIRTPKLQKKKKDSLSYYSALENAGISRLISISDISGEFEYPHLLKLDVFPCGGEANQPAQPPVSILLTLPDRLPGSSQVSSYEDILKERYKWISAFHQSIRSGDCSLKASQTEELYGEMDPTDADFQNIPIRVQERRERHWWSARHRLVCRELEHFNDDLSYEPSDLDNSSLNSSSFDSLRAEPSQLFDHLDPVYPHHPHNEYTHFFNQLKRSGLGLDFGF